MPETATNLASKYPTLFDRFKDSIVGVEEVQNDPTLIVRPESIREIASFLKTEAAPRFETLMDLFAMDYLKYETETPQRFAVVYIFYSLGSHEHLRLKAYLPEKTPGADPEIDSIQDIYIAANWTEREAWDLFGITFKGHPNLVRILCHTEFVGHPLRKDYPSDQYQRLKTAAPSSGF